MKRSNIIITAIIAAFLCTWIVRQTIKLSGQPRAGTGEVITLYGLNGEVIRQWRTESKGYSIPGSGGWVFGPDGAKVIISGTFIVERIPLAPPGVKP